MLRDCAKPMTEPRGTSVRRRRVAWLLPLVLMVGCELRENRQYSLSGGFPAPGYWRFVIQLNASSDAITLFDYVCEGSRRQRAECTMGIMKAAVVDEFGAPALRDGLSGVKWKEFANALDKVRKNRKNCLLLSWTYWNVYGWNIYPGPGNFCQYGSPMIPPIPH